MNENSQTGFILTLISTSAIACGALLCLAVQVLAAAQGCDYSSTTYFLAYLAGSVGFLLTAPINLLLPILKTFPDSKEKQIAVWAATTLAIFLLACLLGVIYMFVFKWTSGGSNPADMATQFLQGAFLLLVSGGIHWLFTRKKQNSTVARKS